MRLRIQCSEKPGPLYNSQRIAIRGCSEDYPGPLSPHSAASRSMRRGCRGEGYFSTRFSSYIALEGRALHVRDRGIVLRPNETGPNCVKRQVREARLSRPGALWQRTQDCFIAVTSISIFMRGSASVAAIIIEAGLTFPKYLRVTGQHFSKSAPSAST